MSHDLFDKNPYILLNVDQNVSSAQAGLLQAFNKAKASKRASMQKLGDARQVLALPAKRLELDALVLAPQVPTETLSMLADGPSTQVGESHVDLVDSLLVLPEIVSSLPDNPPSLPIRRELFDGAPVLTPEIEK